MNGSQAMETRRRRGACAHHAGTSAEQSVERHLARLGRSVTERRWRGASGEIDLVARDGDEIVFVEVKKARTWSEAAGRIGARQIQRIMAAATEYVGTLPTGQLTPMRFDLALVDQAGVVELRENAFTG